MAQAEFGTGKSLVVLAIVLGCFAVLWPKIFYPMMQTAFAMTSPKIDSDGHPDRMPPHFHQSTSGQKMRSSGVNDMHDKFLMREGRPFPHPQARQPAKAQPKSGGAMSIIMPIYTVGIVVFFLYTVMKLLFKKPPDADKKPMIKDFHLDPEYRKFVCQQPTSTSSKHVSKNNNKTTSDTFKSTSLESEEDIIEELDPKDYEIYKLKKKLEDTEQAMERIMKHMGVVNACLNGKTPLENKLEENQNCDIRQRRKTKIKQKSNNKEEEKHAVKNTVGDATTLEEDLAELISLCNETGKNIKIFQNDEEHESLDLKDEETVSKSGDGESSNDEQQEDEETHNICCPTNDCCKKTEACS